MSQFQLPDGTSPELAAIFAKDDVQAILATLIEAGRTPLVQKRDELLGELTTAKATLSKVNALGGLDALTSAQTARADAVAAQQAALVASGDVEAVKRQYSEQLSAKDSELQTLRQSMIDEKVSSKLNKEIRDADGVPELLEPHIKGRIRSELVDGKVRITVLSTTGAPMLNTDGKDAGLGDLIAELKASAIFKRAFNAPAISGSGTRQSGVAGQSNPWNPATRNITQQMSLYRTDPASAKRQAAEHGVNLA